MVETKPAKSKLQVEIDRNSMKQILGKTILKRHYRTRAERQENSISTNSKLKSSNIGDRQCFTIMLRLEKPLLNITPHETYAVWLVQCISL